MGIDGVIAVSGCDGFLSPIGFLVAWLVSLLLVASLALTTWVLGRRHPMA